MNRNIAVGLFVFVGLVLFTVGLFMIGDRREAFAKHLVVYTDFVNLSGLAKGSKVQVAGMDAGQVEEIRIPDSPSAKFRVKMQINEKLHGLVRADSFATIGTEGVVGETFLSILPGSATAPAVQPNAVLPSKEPTQLTDLLTQAQGTMLDADNAIRNASGLLGSVGGNLNSTLTTARSTISDVDTVVNGVKRGDGAVGVLLRDPKTAEAVRQSIVNVQQTTQSLLDTSGKANALVTDIRSRDFPQKVDDTLTSVRDATAKIDDASTGVQKTVAELTKPDDSGNTLAANLRDTVANFDAASENFNEDTEALKHSLFLRAFFRRRGYYSLNGIAPAAYRKDRAIVSRKNPRSWLEADQLFGESGDGRTELTAEGKSLIDNTFNQYGDSFEGVPIMVEGYDSVGTPVERINVSRDRALAVQKYLRDRYHISALDIGAIGLNSSAPGGTGQTSWNGICIVLFRSAH